MLAQAVSCARVETDHDPDSYSRSSSRAAISARAWAVSSVVAQIDVIDAQNYHTGDVDPPGAVLIFSRPAGVRLAAGRYRPRRSPAWYPAAGAGVGSTRRVVQLADKAVASASFDIRSSRLGASDKDVSVRYSLAEIPARSQQVAV